MENRKFSEDRKVSPTTSTDPADISVSRSRREVCIRWQDGHASVYPFDLLRKECPRALCNDQREKAAAATRPSLAVLTGPILKAGEVQVTEASPIGRYAINFVWSDGHSSGIYAFDYLRGLCPCPACRQTNRAVS